MAAPTAQDLLVHRRIISEARISPSSADSRPLQEGEIRLKIECFGLSANNVTYAAMGDMMDYWSIFPAQDDEWGHIPVWGFARVIESSVPALTPGERIFGLFPASSHCILQVGEMNSWGFQDGSTCRSGWPLIYNSYVRQSQDRHFLNESPEYQAALRPLFLTSYLIDRFLLQHNLFEADTVLLGSASSKTAIGTAALLTRSRPQRRPYRVVGLTSSVNADFVSSLGCYDGVADYARINEMNADEKVVFVDMSGNIRVRKAVHVHFGDNLLYSCWVGASHWTKLAVGVQLPGPDPVFFFAPSEYQSAQELLGFDEFNAGFHGAWRSIVSRIEQVIRLITVTGSAEILSAYQEIVRGEARPHAASVVSFD